MKWFVSRVRLGIIELVKCGLGFIEWWSIRVLYVIRWDLVEYGFGWYVYDIWVRADQSAFGSGLMVGF